MLIFHQLFFFHHHFIPFLQPNSIPSNTTYYYIKIFFQIIMRMIYFLLTNPCIGLSICKKRNILRLVKIDGDVVEFEAPVMVKELMIKFEGFGIKSSRKSSCILPPNFELKMGRKYYLLPIKAPDDAKKIVTTKVEPEKDTTVKRIKVVITKKQLEELLAKKTSMEKILFGIDTACSSGSGENWEPSLVSIPEESEMNMH